MPSDEQQQFERLGDPFAASDRPRGKRDVTPDRAAVDAESYDRHRRRGDTGLGDPERPAEVVRRLSANETQQHEQELADELQERFEAKLAELAEADRGWPIPKSLRVAATWTLVLVAAMLGLVLVSQATQVAADIALLPLYARWLAIGGAVLFGGVLAFVFARICLLILQLNRSPRVNVRALSILHERKEMQHLAATHQAEAKKILSKYLETYPLDRSGARSLRAAGIIEEEIEALQRLRDRLLDPNRPLGAGEWLSEFTTGFQATLDTAATRRVSQYAKRVGAGTAMSPVAMVDQMIVLYGCSAMVKDLMRMYHLRPALGQTAVIISRGIIHAYLSGMVEDATEAAADGVADWFGDSIGALGGTIGRAASAKAAEAGLNGLLLWRLGMKARRLMAPVVSR